MSAELDDHVTAMTSQPKRKSIFENVDDLLAPEPTTSDQEKLECPLCSKSYVTFFGLRRHIKSHLDGHVDQTCPHCHKHYNSSGALKMHLNTHSLPFVCEICGKNFSRPWLLKGHKRTHTGERPFICTECGRKFADRSNLRAHEQTHVETKKYRCIHCEQSFARVQVKLKHEQNCRKRAKNEEK